MHQLGYKDKVFIYMTVDCVFMFMIFSLKAKSGHLKKNNFPLMYIININHTTQVFMLASLAC